MECKKAINKILPYQKNVDMGGYYINKFSI